MEEPRGRGQGRDHHAHGETQALVVLQQDDHDAEQSQRAGEQLVRAPGQHTVERVDVRVGAADDAALVGFIEVIERKPLDVLEDRQTQIVHRALADGDGAFDLRRRKEPADQQITEINQADGEDAVERGLGAGKADEVTVDADLNKFRSHQLRSRRQQHKAQLEPENPPVRTDVAEQPQKRRLAHGLLLECFFK